MRQISLTNSTLFEPLVAIESSDLYIDLHNDYNCKEIVHMEGVSKLQLIFESTSQPYKKVIVVFQEVTIVRMSLPLQHTLVMGITLDTFYRGRFEENGSLKEYSDQGKGYYYVSFDEDYFIELFSNSVNALVE